MNNAMPSQSIDESRYFIRVIIVIAVLVALIISALFFAPRLEEVRVRPSPTGVVPTDTVITIVFSRPVDRPSAERAFTLYPTVSGRLSWRDDHTMIFTPSGPLQPRTRYNVTIGGGLRDTRNAVNRSPTAWSFLTR